MVKTVSLSDEAYALLDAARRGPKDSFSKIVTRAFGGPRRRPEDCAGGWKDMTDEEAELLHRSVRAAFEEIRRP